ncbi:hypothetical protein VMUT_1140 [Vulcanisaeta moutnovskia 768-28]|uniref:Uncharacterized protein n=1 Tax=Vulcanisaeta moutnovskia (strain 768-28) TaxID=985053 RepID=F0QYA8_VULM7|nr:hypothetical protein [Vulcanisaeta moutnovskia]ADY01345.1 hypothetical protein VMUT_1140 [Vulcanisaeta moutnovskia 768-28]
MARAERWPYNDVNGKVYGYPAVIDLNIAIRNDMHVLVEVKSSISGSDVDGFWSIGRLYESSDVRHRLVIVSPYVDDRAAELSRELGMEVYTGVT